MTATINLPAIATNLLPECTGCYRETEQSSALRAFQPRRGGCPLHQDTPASAVVQRIRAALGKDARITVTRGEVTVEYTVTGRDMDAIEDEWAAFATACGIPKAWQRLLVSSLDTEVKARVRHGHVEAGMASEFRRGVPVRLVAHGWTAAVELAEELQAAAGYVTAV
jgi:hypothetical protein